MSIDTLLSGNIHLIALAGDVSSQIRPSPTIQRASRDVPENRLVHEQHAPVAESPKSPLKTQSQGEIKGTYKPTCARIHAHVRYPRDVGSEAQFFVRANEGESRLGPHCSDGQWGHPSRTPSGESALRWPCRLRRAIWTKSDAGAAPDPGSECEFFCGTSGLPIRAFRACGCCWPMPRRSPRTPLPRVRSSLWPWQYAADAFQLVHTVLSLDSSRGHFGVAD